MYESYDLLQQTCLVKEKNIFMSLYYLPLHCKKTASPLPSEIYRKPRNPSEIKGAFLCESHKSADQRESTAVLLHG